MKIHPSSMLFSYVLSYAYAAEQKNIFESCNDVYGILECDTTVEYPIDTDPIRDGTGAVVDLDIKVDKVNICDAVTNALGSYDFVDNKELNCRCLSSAVDWGNTPTAKPIFDGQVNGQCLADNDFTISTDRASVLKSQLPATNGWTIVRGPDIDVATYKRLLKAVVSCYTGTEVCDKAKVRAFFASYVENADSITDSELVRMLNKWVTLFASLKKKTTDVQTYAKQVQARLKTVSNKVNSVKANVCKNNACKGSTPTNAFKKYSSTFSTIKSLQGVPNAAERSLANIPKMTQIARDAIKYTTTPADEAYYVNLVNDYQINSLRDVIKAFRVTQYFPQAAEDLKKLTGTFNLISNHAGAARSGATSINQILSTNWAKNSELAKTASGRKVRDGLISIQKSFRNDLKGPLDNLIKANKAVEDLLNQFPLRKKRFEFVSGGVPYNRWTNVRMAVPCRKETSRPFTRDGFTKSYPYSKIEACEFGPAKVPFIKHVIPYIKYRFV
ncbi:hypothetical protein F53441_8244 [Fusarium austroafricanum]|uniref:Uncharacterized protein n=1 Tax=Fusarium austroafricanum TaxID=2364996 RepID=A0A8H4KBS4_9HYPO|nr:hypothetical protein F53441_8244 [Fusarium austroafricanum]